VNGPVRWGKEPLTQSGRKLLKSALASRPSRATLAASIAALERVAPDSGALDRLYRLLMGSHLLRGYRRGLAREDNFRTSVPETANVIPTDSVKIA
jgi:hypothetical protein